MLRLPSSIATMLDPALPRRERDLVEFIRSVPDLDGVLQDVDIAEIVQSTSDRRLGTRSRSELIDVLCRERAAELSVPTLVRIVTALRTRMILQSHRHGVRDLLCGARGERSIELRYALNGGDDHHDLEHLVFELLDPASRAAVLRHFTREAASQRSAEVRILCDIDDTLLSAIHDRRYRRGTLYPGVVELLHALDRGAGASPGRPGDLTFVTARPVGPWGLIERYTRNGLRGLGLPQHAVLGGSFLNVFTKATISARKLQNFDHERALFPESKRLFIGDNGQADVLVGREMLRRDPVHVATVLIHAVVPVSTAHRAKLRRAGIIVFDTYAGAAVAAVEQRLIAVEDAAAIVDIVTQAVVTVPEPEARAALLASVAADAERLDALKRRRAERGSSD